MAVLPWRGSFMQFQVFQYPLPAPPDLEDLNAYLASHLVASVSHQIVQTAGGAMLVFLVQTVARSEKGEGRSSEPRVDYREVLNAEDFALFSRLRNERRAISEAEGVPKYAVFTNAQLAEMVTRKVRTVEAVAAIEGIGAGRVEKYAARMLAVLSPPVT